MVAIGSIAAAVAAGAQFINTRVSERKHENINESKLGRFQGRFWQAGCQKQQTHKNVSVLGSKIWYVHQRDGRSRLSAAEVSIFMKQKTDRELIALYESRLPS